MKIALAFSAVVVAAGLVACGKKDQPQAAAPVDFATQIKPLLEAKCVICHNSSTLVGQLNVENREGAFGESERGKFIVPGDPDASLLYTITLAAHGKRKLPEGIDKPMPEKMPDLSDAEKAILKRWIEEGATWPEAEGHVKPPQVPTAEA